MSLRSKIWISARSRLPSLNNLFIKKNPQPTHNKKLRKKIAFANSKRNFIQLVLKPVEAGRIKGMRITATDGVLGK